MPAPAITREARMEAAYAQERNISRVAEGHRWEWTPTRSYAKIFVGEHVVRAIPGTTSFRLEFAPGIQVTTSLRRLGDRRGWQSYYVDHYWIAEAQNVLQILETMPLPSRSERRVATPARAAARNRALGVNRRFGIEIEFFGISRATAADALRAAGLDLSQGYGASTTSWNLKTDGSVTGSGLELVSPPISGEAGLDQVRVAMRALRNAGARVDRTCGLHVHHEVRDLGPTGAVRFVKSWAANQRLIDWLVAPSRRAEAMNNYSRPFDQRELNEMGATSRGITGAPRGRYKNINVHSYSRYGTVEVRQHQGTLEFRKAEAWIRLGQSMLDAVATSGAELPAQPGLRGLISAAQMDEDAGAYLLGRAIQFEAPAEMVAA